MVLQLMAGLMMILIGAELFTNSVEWLGSRLRLPEGSVGHLLAAVGTALPESMVPLVAFMSGGIDSVDIGIGAILGAPFMLGTLAMFITGFAAWILRGRKTGRKIMHVDAVDMKRDLRFFICMYLLVIAAAFLPQWSKRYIATLLILSYVRYVSLRENRLHRCHQTRLSESEANFSIIRNTFDRQLRGRGDGGG